MKRESQNAFYISVCLLTAFILWTAAVCLVDVQAVGPQGSTVGFATINRFAHVLTGVHMPLYTATDWLGLVPLGFALGFALLGLIQWIKRKHLLKVDFSILALGVFYMAVIAIYILFELFPVNYRPVLIDGFLEASYPSSTTLLMMCVMPSSAMQISTRIKKNVLKRCILLAITAFTVFTVIGRFISGVHWLSDIVGGSLLSAGLVMMYRSISSLNTR